MGVEIGTHGTGGPSVGRESLLMGRITYAMPPRTFWSSRDRSHAILLHAKKAWLLEAFFV